MLSRAKSGIALFLARTLAVAFLELLDGQVITLLEIGPRLFRHNTRHVQHYQSPKNLHNMNLSMQGLASLDMSTGEKPLVLRWQYDMLTEQSEPAGKFFGRKLSFSCFSPSLVLRRSCMALASDSLHLCEARTQARSRAQKCSMCRVTEGFA